MEEDILEKKYKKAMKVLNETSLPLFVEDTFEDILLAYKNELERLQKEFEDWQKAYQEEKDEQFNMLTKKCLHCGNDTPLYCEKCYQELISKNAELQLENEELKNNKKVVANINIALDDMKEYIDGAINNILIENYIPKQVIRDKIQEYEAQGYIEIAGALKELLGE